MLTLGDNMIHFTCLIKIKTTLFKQKFRCCLIVLSWLYVSQW